MPREASAAEKKAKKGDQDHQEKEELGLHRKKARRKARLKALQKVTQKARKQLWPQVAQQ